MHHVTLPADQASLARIPAYDPALDRPATDAEWQALMAAVNAEQARFLPPSLAPPPNPEGIEPPVPAPTEEPWKPAAGQVTAFRSWTPPPMGEGVTEWVPPPGLS